MVIIRGFGALNYVDDMQNDHNRCSCKVTRSTTTPNGIRTPADAENVLMVQMTELDETNKYCIASI